MEFIYPDLPDAVFPAGQRDPVRSQFLLGNLILAVVHHALVGNLRDGQQHFFIDFARFVPDQVLQGPDAFFLVEVHILTADIIFHPVQVQGHLLGDARWFYLLVVEHLFQSFGVYFTGSLFFQFNRFPGIAFRACRYVP